VYVTGFKPKREPFRPKARGLVDAPVYLTIPECAELMKRKTKYVWQWLDRCKLIDRRGGRPVVITDRLLAEFPELKQRLLLRD
jgi:hypothetical protein